MGKRASALSEVVSGSTLTTLRVGIDFLFGRTAETALCGGEEICNSAADAGRSQLGAARAPISNKLQQWPIMILIKS
jgi:hypothetical protein